MPEIMRPIIVTGCARSGTSMVAGVLHSCGAWVGECTGATQWNKKGQFENVFIRDELTKPYLKKLGVDPMGQDPLPVIDEPAMRAMGEKWRRRVLQSILAQGYDGQKTWLFKGAKACLIWPVWAEAFPAARWVVVRRDDEAIIDSCMKTSFMRKHRTRDGWQSWIDHHKRCWRQMGPKVGHIEVWSDHLVKSVHYDDYTVAQWLVKSMGLELNESKIKEFIDPRLWNG